MIRILFICIILVACATANSHDGISVESLVANAAANNGRRVTVCGWMQAKRELCELSAQPSNFGTTGSLWIGATGGWCDAEKVIANPFEGWATVSGVFETGETYGHFGAWDHALSDAVVTPRKASCDNLEENEL